MAQQLKQFYEFGPFRADLAERLLMRGDERIPLEPLVFDLLSAMVERPNELLEAEWLTEKVWGNSHIGSPEKRSANLQVNISKLRNALGDDPAQPHYIETIPRRGYRFITEVRKTVNEAKPESHKNSTTRQRGLLMLASGLILIGVIVVIRYFTYDPPPRPTIKSVAVLPFGLINDDERVASMGEGIAAELILKLGEFREIRVLPWERVLIYRHPRLLPEAIGRELQVDLVLAGNIQTVPETVRVTLRLINVNDSRQFWAGTIDVKFSDVLPAQDLVVNKVIPDLKRELVMTRYTENAEAFDLYQQGRKAWQRRTVEDVRKSISYYEQAINKDKNFALAYSGLADAYFELGPISLGLLLPEEAMQKQKDAALKALELDRNLAEAYTSLAITKMFYYWEWGEAEEHFKQAISLYPGYAIAYHWYSAYLTSMGRSKEGIEKAKRALELDSTSIRISGGLAAKYHFAGEYKNALDQYHRTIQMMPAYPGPHHDLAQVYEAMGDYGKAEEELKIALELSGLSIANPDARLGTALGHLYAVSGRKEKAREILDALGRAAQSGKISPVNFAILYTALEEKDKAIEWLEKAYQERSPFVVYLKVDPRFDDLRTDSKFTDLLKRIGLLP